MKKLKKKQKHLIIDFIENNLSAPQYLPCSEIDPSGAIENLNRYENCCNDIEEFYSDSCSGRGCIEVLRSRVDRTDIDHQIWYTITNQEEKEIERRKNIKLTPEQKKKHWKNYGKWRVKYLKKFLKV